MTGIFAISFQVLLIVPLNLYIGFYHYILIAQTEGHVTIPGEWRQLVIFTF